MSLGPLDPFLIPGGGLYPIVVLFTRIDTQDVRDGTILEIDISNAQITPSKANLSSSTNWVFAGGLSGSIQQVAGLSYVAAGSGITVVSSSNGQITISTAAGLADAKYLVLDLNSSLTNERVLTFGLGLTGSDTGPNGVLTADINNSIVATLTGSRFSGNIRVNGTSSFYTGLSGSLTQLTTGQSYIIGGTNITVTSQSNGQITINAIDGTSGLVSFDDLVFGEAVTGLVNGINTIFTTSQEPTPSTSLVVYKNGLRMLSGSSNDYVLSGTFEVGTKLIKFSEPPLSASSIVAGYQRM